MALQDDVEGVQDSAGFGWGDYPLDAVFVRTEQRTVSEVVNRIKAQRYVLDPEFQRTFVWSNQKQSKLIESALMRIPLPVFYVAEDRDGKIIVVDGLQRLTTFSRFLANEFKLAGLTNAEEDNGEAHALEGKYFKDLPLNLQERVLDTQLTMYILDAKAPERARLDIFERVNSGAPLTRQQMRNALYNGPATVWLREAAESAVFREATGGSLNTKTMRDREAINRFCAFKLLGWSSYKQGDMDDFLAKGLLKLAALQDVERATLRTGFDVAMHINQTLFGQHAFRKSLIEPTGYRSVINISLFEVCAVTMTNMRHVLSNPDALQVLKKTITSLMQNEIFVRAITYSTNSTAAVARRFDAMAQAVSIVTER